MRFWNLSSALNLFFLLNTKKHHRKLYCVMFGFEKPQIQIGSMASSKPPVFRFALCNRSTKISHSLTRLNGWRIESEFHYQRRIKNQKNGQRSVLIWKNLIGWQLNISTVTCLILKQVKKPLFI